MQQTVEVLKIVVLGLAATLQVLLAARLLGVRLSFRNNKEAIRRYKEQQEKIKTERRAAGTIEDVDKDERE